MRDGDIHIGLCINVEITPLGETLTIYHEDYGPSRPVLVVPNTPAGDASLREALGRHVQMLIAQWRKDR